VKKKILYVRWTRGVKRCIGMIALIAATLAISTPAFAVLGGSEASVQTDQVQMQASLRSTRVGAYTVHELHTPSGIVIREYASGGTVFAVAWQGPWRPDMRQLLGSYFDQYEEGLQAQSGNRPGRRPVHIELPGLVVRMAGHPRSFTGQAYVPDMLPQGMTAEEIR
jgi:Protein of unknown function (DUF2844)